MDGQLNIETVTAFIMRDPGDGTEGIVGCSTPIGFIPMIAADGERIESLEPRAQEIANASGITIELVRFEHRVSIKFIEPNRAAPKTKLVPLGNDLFGVSKPEKKEEEP